MDFQPLGQEDAQTSEPEEVQVPRIVAFIIILLRNVANLLHSAPLLRCLSIVISFAIFVSAFLVSRLWFFVDFPLPGIFPDSGLYHLLAKQISSGQWPDFSIRPPVYPLLIWLVYATSGKLLTLIIIQSLLSFCAISLMIYAVWKLQWQLGPLTALAMTAWAVSANTLEHETALLSDSPNASLLILAFAFLILGFAVPQRYLIFALSSFCMGLSILTRPATMFLLVIYLMVAVYLCWGRFSKKHLLCFFMPMPILLLALCFYNLLKVGTFTISAFGEMNLIGATALLWEQDTAYPDQFNKMIERIQARKRDLLSEEQKRLLEHSWDREKLAIIYANTYNPLTYSEGVINSSRDRLLIRKVAFDSIKKHPDQYLKFVWTQLQQYFSLTGDFDLPSHVADRAKGFYIDKTYVPSPSNGYPTDIAREYVNPPTLKSLLLTEHNTKLDVSLSETELLRLYRSLRSLRLDTIRNIPWILLFIILLALSVFRLIQTRAKHNGAFIVFILTISIFGASLIVCLVELAMGRYSYPMEWVYFLSPALIFLLFQKTGTYSEAAEAKSVRAAPTT